MKQGLRGHCIACNPDTADGNYGWHLKRVSRAASLISWPCRACVLTVHDIFWIHRLFEVVRNTLQCYYSSTGIGCSSCCGVGCRRWKRILPQDVGLMRKCETQGHCRQAHFNAHEEVLPSFSEERSLIRESLRREMTYPRPQCRRSDLSCLERLE